MFFSSLVILDFTDMHSRLIEDCGKVYLNQQLALCVFLPLTGAPRFLVKNKQKLTKDACPT